MTTKDYIFIYFHYFISKPYLTHEINIALPKRGAKVMSVHSVSFDAKIKRYLIWY